MIGWLRRLFTGEPDCQHEYAEKYRLDLFSMHPVLLYDRPAGVKIIMCCKKCGWLCERTF